MAFIDKKDPVVLNIKLTSKGRELLSTGKLNFKYFGIGDSEIDYVFNKVSGLDTIKYNILRPADKNPNQLSFIMKNLSGDTLNLISNIPSTPTIITNTAPSLGFFTITTDSTSFITDTDHIKQPDVMIMISGVTGGVLLDLYKSPTYIANINEPAIGDLILIKWTNPYGINTTGYTVNTRYPTPYLIYKIEDIASGSLANNNLRIKVDRNLPNFNGITGGSNNIVAGALIYYNYINFTGDTIYNEYSTDYINESTLAFLQNCQCPTITFPFWNMSIVYTEEIDGVQLNQRSYGKYGSNIYGGFVSYIQNQAPVYKKLGIIHYSNSSPSNTYAEELYKNTPVLNLPTIMWHKSVAKTMGLTLKAYGSVKSLTGITKSLNTTYYDLADLGGNIVGKIFNNLKLFVIEDQELLFAISYKSNRSWTLPNYGIGINDDIVFGCPDCAIDFLMLPLSASTIGGSNAAIFIYNIINNIPDDKYGLIGDLILSVSGITSGQLPLVRVLKRGFWIKNLKPDTYYITINDLNAIGCTGKTITIKERPPKLKLYYLTGTSSGLNPDFNITINNPAYITVFQSNIGTTYGTLQRVGYKLYGAADNTIIWQTFASGKVDISLSFSTSYTIVVSDSSGTTFDFRVSKDYVSVGNPLNSNFSINQGYDTGGTYVNIWNYLGVQTPNNPIVGNIEYSLYSLNSVPRYWTITSGANGSVQKAYIQYGQYGQYYNQYYGQYSVGTYNVAIRERKGKIEMFKVIKTITII